METIILDLRNFESAVNLQSYLAQTLKFPFYYGRNLDALYDELTLWQGEALKVLLPERPIGGMADYIPRVERVFLDAAADNPGLKIEIVK